MITEKYIEILESYKEIANTYAGWSSVFVNNTILPDEVAERTCADNPLNIICKKIGYHRKFSLYPRIEAESDEDVYEIILKLIYNLREEFRRKKIEADKTQNLYDVYLIEPGDSGWSIAKNVYGSGFEFQKIVDFKPNEIPDLNEIYPAQALFIPR